MDHIVTMAPFDGDTKLKHISSDQFRGQPSLMLFQHLQQVFLHELKYLRKVSRGAPLCCMYGAFTCNSYQIQFPFSSERFFQADNVIALQHTQNLHFSQCSLADDIVICKGMSMCMLLRTQNGRWVLASPITSLPLSCQLNPPSDSLNFLIATHSPDSCALKGYVNLRKGSENAAHKSTG
jgi:hypothetical protein